MAVFSVVLRSGSAESFYEAVSFAAAARAQGKTVLLFLRGPALEAFVKDPPAQESGLSPSPDELLQEIRAKGKVHVYACSAWARRLGLDAPAAAARVDAVIGLAGFLSQAEGGAILYI
jgi:peroxiredoxin family protein